MKTADDRSKAAGNKRTLELRFSERISDSNKAIEVGIYKGTFTNSKGETHTYYGRFHVVLRKEGETWKILVDTDSSESGTIGEDDFTKAKPFEQ
jgi:ketosteroid isomerase-like protein